MLCSFYCAFPSRILNTLPYIEAQWGWVGGEAMVTAVIDVAVTVTLTSNFINEKIVWPGGLLLVVKIVNV